MVEDIGEEVDHERLWMKLYQVIFREQNMQCGSLLSSIQAY